METNKDNTKQVYSKQEHTRKRKGEDSLGAPDNKGDSDNEVEIIENESNQEGRKDAPKSKACAVNNANGMDGNGDWNKETRSDKESLKRKMKNKQKEMMM